MTNALTIPALGASDIPSPLKIARFTGDDERVLFSARVSDFNGDSGCLPLPPSVELAGPREKLFFDPTQTRAAIVTCGGLCPGINDVIRSITMTLYHRYGVRDILGIPFGFRGLNPEYGHHPIFLTPDFVKDITHIGGSILSTSRGPQDIGIMVDYLDALDIQLLFCVGGDGTMRAAEKISNEVLSRGYPISVIGIPKTIDNDLDLIEKSFGFDTAIEKSVEALRGAHVEAKGAFNGIGLVKIMGRHSGYIAATAALAQGDVNFVLIPEVPFSLGGEGGFLHVLESRILKRGHAVVLVAEGAGQDLVAKGIAGRETDASGNIRLKDIGLFLKEAIESHFSEVHTEINLKYIEPSYLIRSIPANASDSIYCASLGQYSVHAAMAGKTSLLVALRKNEYVHLPLHAAVSGRQIDPEGNMWLRVLEMTGQPPLM